MSTSARNFIETGELTPGVTLLEASAGTGKTYQITNLVVRLVAEYGLAMREILVVTFTKAATAELVERVRVRLGQAVAVLRGQTVPSGDQMLASLRDRADRAGVLSEWLRRLVLAQEQFDQAVISTIHGFCQRMLQQNAFESGAEFELELIADDSELVADLVDDFLSAQVNSAPLHRYRFLVRDCGFRRDALLKTARTALGDPDMALVPLELGPECPSEFRDRARAALAAWDAGWRALGLRFDAGKPTQANQKKRPQMKLFHNSRQATYISFGLRKRDALVRGWLEGCLDGPVPPVPARVAKYFNREAFEAALAPGVSFHHPLFDEICALASWGEKIYWESSSAHTTEPWHGFVHWIRQAYQQHKARERQVAFQDLMRKLAAALQEPQLVAAIRPRFRAALIDEFQDTDQLQWQIFQTLFHTKRHYLFLIGDPKQAIYGFRGANVHVYVQVKRSAERTLSMRTNYRSDVRYVEAMNRVLGRWPHSLFGDPNIAYEAVAADETRRPVDRLIPPIALGADPWRCSEAAPLQIRFAHLAGRSADDPVSKGVVRRTLPARVAADVVQFLQAGWQLQESEEQAPRPVHPGDIAVLVRTGWQAKAVLEGLMAAGVAAVMPASQSVFESDEAADLQRWLEAVARPTDARAARAAAATRLFGWNAQDLLAVDQTEDPNGPWEDWLFWLSRWHVQAGRQGVLPTFRAAMERRDVSQALLQFPDGERRLTDLLHVLELVHGAEQSQRLRPEGLIRWLADQRLGVGTDSGAAEQRLERDDAAVRVLTMHKSKGLQYPVVWAPFLYDGVLVREGDQTHLVFPTPDDASVRQLDLQQRPFPAQKLAHIEAAAEDAHAERVRLLYVALTRARHRCVLYDGRFTDKRVAGGGLENSALGLLLHSLDLDDGPVAAEQRFARSAERIAEMDAPALYEEVLAWSDLCVRDNGDRLLGVSRAPLDGEVPAWSGRDLSTPTLAARQFSRTDDLGQPVGLDHTWKQLSYSYITRARQGVGFDEQVLRQEVALAGRDVDQQTDRPGSVAPTHDELLRQSLPIEGDDEGDVPLAAFPGGADAGTFLHEVFEVLDFQQFPRSLEAANTGAEALERTLNRLGPKHAMNRADWREILHRGLPSVLQTPLGGPLGDLRLADLPPSRRLNELAFDLPVAGGSAHKRRMSDGDMPWPSAVDGAAFGEAFLLAADAGPSTEYLQGLATAWQTDAFAGFLTGSIDLVFSVPGATEAEPTRYYVADYKSNRLDHLRERLHPSRHFCQAWMRHEMQHHDYFVQATLYTLAVHRYLQHRLTDYDYNTHHGGALYLFIRGMTGEQTAQESGLTRGVFHFRPPWALIERLDALLEACHD